MKHHFSQIESSPLVAVLRHPLYRKAAFVRKPGLRPEQTIPLISSSSYSHKIDMAKVRGLNDLCGAAGDESSTRKPIAIPLTYPHLIAGDLHLSNMLDRRFPLPILGTVHIRNVIQWWRPLQANDVLDIEAFIDGHRNTDQGIEFDLQTRVRAGDDLVWRSASTMLNRTGPIRRSKGVSRKPNAHALKDQGATASAWSVDLATARRYAALSGDYNPIHLHNFTARLFGFKKAIIHGMWTVARVSHALASDYRQTGTLTCAFAKPVFLPATVQCWLLRDDQGWQYQITNDTTTIAHVSGTVTEENIL